MRDQVATCVEGCHDLSICSVDNKQNVEDGYFFGVCLRCGSTFEVKYKQIEEAFSDGHK